MALPRINPAYLQKLSPKERAEIERELAKLEILNEQDPLGTFEPNCPEQEKFLRATTKTQAAFAGNQAGKTTALVVKALIQVVPRDRLPSHLQQFKIAPEGPVSGRVVAPAINERIMQTFRQWTPKHILKEGSFDKSWRMQDKILQFEDGSFIDFLSYETDLDKFGSVQRHFIGYDEPPPQEIRDEGLFRLVRFDGFEMFAMTPLKSNTGWIRREIWRKRESPDIQVAKWSIHDNKNLSAEAVKQALEKTKSDLWRRAREFGDFVDVGGTIYPNFEDAVLKDIPLDRDEAREALKARVQNSDVIVGIDPGLRNAAFVWVAFDRDSRALVFDEVLLQEKLPADYAKAIRRKNAEWGVKDVAYVIDPAYRTRAQASGENVESALVREGIYCIPGNNNVEAGCMQWRGRMEQGMCDISPICVGLRDEADDYAMEDREDGVFKEVRNDNSHRLDAGRYVFMYRPWFMHEESEQSPLGWTPGEMPSLADIQEQGRERQTSPMGFMS